VNAVMRGHVKLPPDVRVAGIAEIGLGTGQQVARRGCFVNRVATRADDIIRGMHGPADVGSGQTLAMASQTPIEYAGWLQNREGDDLGFVAVSGNVGKPGTV